MKFLYALLCVALGLPPAACSRSSSSSCVDRTHCPADGGIDSGAPDGSDAGSTQWTNIGIGSPVAKTADGGASLTFSGRVNALRVAPDNPAIAYLGAAGGGVWKSSDFLDPIPQWQPLTDGMAHLSVSAIDVDPHAPMTIYAAMGDLDGFIITIHALLTKSTDGGASLSTPVPIVDAATGAQVSIIYDLRVDPSSSQVLLVGSDLGLLRSKDGGATFSRMTLPTAGGTQVTSAVHSLAFVGATNGVSSWVAAGVYACDAGKSPPTFVGSPSTASCPVGNLGDLWRSADGGQTWTSMRASTAQTFPGWNGIADSSTTNGATGLGRIQLATTAGAAANPTSSTVYGLAMSIDAHASVDVLRSVDGGQTWASLWVAPGGTVSNPAAGFSDIAVAQRRTGAIAVDPTDANHVLIGGTSCALRTLDGLSGAPVWDNVLNGVHVDWRTETALVAAGQLLVFSGNDGGLYVSTNLFSTPEGSESAVSWTPLNQGLFTQLVFAVGSGDPADGNTATVLAGSQDIGAFILDAQPLWDTVGGGDVSGAVVNGGVAWWGAEILRFCALAARDCRLPSNWQNSAFPLPTGDTVPLASVRFSPILDGSDRALAISKLNVWLSAPDPMQTWTWTRVTPTNLPASTTNVFASPSVPGLFGVTMDDGTCAVTGNGLDAAPTWTVSQPIGDGTTQLQHASMIAFAPQTLPGAQPGDVYLAASVADALPSGGAIPDSVGHLLVTRDRGATWQAVHGAGLGQDLPNAPIHVVRYDPSDPTGGRIYVASDRGVYRSTDGGMTWLPLGSLPGAPVTDLFISRDGRLLRAATLGRGIWELSNAKAGGS